MKTSKELFTASLLHEESSPGGQTVWYHAIWRTVDTKHTLRVTIKRDHYLFQSYAHVEVFDPIHKQWNMLWNLLSENIKSYHAKNEYKGNGTFDWQIAGHHEDENTLIKQALQILY